MGNNTNLTDYILERAYGKGESFNRDEINALLDNIRNQELDLINIVLELPTTDIRSDRLYLVYNPDGDEGNLFDVFIYIQGKWEQLDGLNFKISDYYTQSQMDGLLYNKANSSELNRTVNSLNTVKDDLTSLYSNLTEFNEALIEFDEDNTNLSEDLTKLKDNVGIFIGRVNGLISGLDTLKDEFDDLSVDLEDTKTDLSSLQEDLVGEDGLSESLSSLRNDLEDTKTSLGTVQSDIASAQDEITSLKSKDTDLTGQLNNLSDSLNSTTGSLSETNNLLAGLREEFNALNTEFDSAVGVLNTATSDIDDLQSETGTLTSNLNRVDSELTTTKTNLSTTSNKLSSLDKELNGDKESNPDDTGLKGQLEVLSSNVDNLGSSTNTLNADLTTLTGRLDVTESNLETTSKGLSKLDKELNGDKESNPDDTGLKGSLQDLSSTVSTVQSDINSLQEADTTLQGNINTLSVDLNGDGTHNGLKSDLSSLQESLYGDENDDSKNGLVGDIHQLQSDTSRMNVNLTKLTDGLFDANDELKVTGDQIIIFSQELDQFLSDLNILGDYVNNFEGSLTDFKQELTDNNVEFETFELESNIVNLFGSLSLVKNDITGLKDRADVIETDISDVNTTLYGDDDNVGVIGQIETVQDDISTINETTIPNVESSIQTVDGKVTTTNNRIDTVNNRIDTVNTNIDTVNARVDTVNTVIGDETNPSDTSLRGKINDSLNRVEEVKDTIGDENNGLIHDINTNTTNIVNAQSDIATAKSDINQVQNDVKDTQNTLYGVDGSSDNLQDDALITKVNTTSTIIGDENTGLIHDIQVNQEDISNATDNINDLQTELYGGEGHTFDSPSDESYINLLNTTNNDLETTKTVIGDKDTGLVHDLQVVDDKVDTAREQLNKSIEYINNVQKIVYGDNTYYYTCNETEWSEYTIDTKDLTGELYVKFLVYPVNNILLKDISVVDNGDFSNGLTGWTTSNDTDITVNSNICRLNSSVQVMILSQDNVDFTNVDSISFKVKADDLDPNTDIINGLFVYLGDEEENTGLLDTLTNFSVSLQGFEGSLNGLSNDLTEATDRLDVAEEDIDNTIVKVDTITNEEGTGSLDVAVTDIKNVEDDIKDITNTNGTGTLDIVRTDLDGITNNNGTGSLDIVINNVNDITNEEGTGSLDIVQDDINGLNTTIGDNNTGLIHDINTAKTDITTANGNITNLKNSVGTVNVSQNGNLQNQVFNINQINDLIKEALNNTFTSPSSLNNNTKYIFIPSSSESTSSNYLNTQEYNLMKYDYGFPIDNVDYFLMRNHTLYYKRNSSTLKYIDEEDLVEELNGYNVVYVCYSLSNSGLSGNLGNDYDNKPLIYNYLYEISSKKYYGLHFGAVPINY